MCQSLPSPPALPQPSSQAAWHAAGTELRPLLSDPHGSLGSADRKLRGGEGVGESLVGRGASLWDRWEHRGRTQAPRAGLSTSSPFPIQWLPLTQAAHL